MTNITKMRQEVLEDLYSQAMENREIVRDVCAKFVSNMAPEEVRQAHHDAGLGDDEEPKLAYLTIRGCVEIDGEVESFAISHDGETNPAAVGDTMRSVTNNALDCDAARSVKTYWTLYAHKTDGTEEAIGDFKSFEHAYRMQNLLLMPMREAVNGALAAISPSYNSVETTEAVHEVAARLDDICNQSSTEEHL